MMMSDMSCVVAIAGPNATVPMNCVAQMPHPVVTPQVAIQTARAHPSAAQARWNNVIAVKLACTQTTATRRVDRTAGSVAREERVSSISAVFHTASGCGER